MYNFFKLFISKYILIHYLLNGTIQYKAKNNIQDTELLLQFEKVEKPNDNKKYLVKEFLDAFILKSTLQQQLT